MLNGQIKIWSLSANFEVFVDDLNVDSAFALVDAVTDDLADLNSRLINVFNQFHNIPSSAQPNKRPVKFPQAFPEWQSAKYASHFGCAWLVLRYCQCRVLVMQSELENIPTFYAACETTLWMVFDVQFDPIDRDRYWICQVFEVLIK